MDLARVPGPKGANGGLLGPYEATFSAPPGLFRQSLGEVRKKRLLPRSDDSVNRYLSRVFLANLLYA